jgi:hypothetical protein
MKDNRLARGSLAMLWIGRVISAVPAAFLLISAGIKFMPLSPEMTEGLKHIGWGKEHMSVLGVTELVCTILYLVPQTSPLGAILLTGYLGGAIATHVRVGDPIYIPAALGVLIWLGLCLREPRLWSLLPRRWLGSRAAGGESAK